MSFQYLEDLPSPSNTKNEWPWTLPYDIVSYSDFDMMHYPKISIVTPSYNQGSYIEETIRSVLLQGYPNFEYIIIDGGSNDETIEIIQRYQAFISYWVSEPDRGQGHAINKGFRLADGDIFYWLNSDDVLASNTFFKIAHQFNENPQVGVFYGDFYFVDENTKITSKFPTKPFSIDMLLYGNIIGQPTAFFKREIWNKFGKIDESWKFILDYELWVRWALFGVEFRYAQELLAYYRIHEQSKTVTLTRTAQNEVMKLFSNLIEEKKISQQQSMIFPVVIRNFCNANYANLDLSQFWHTFFYYIFRAKQMPSFLMMRNAMLSILGHQFLNLLRRIKSNH